MEDALYRNLCTTQIVSRTSRESMARSRCEDVELVETLICIIPSGISADPELDDLPHPDIKNAFISQRGDNFLRDLWLFNANPFHAAQPILGRTTSGGFKIINRGRKIATRGKVSVTFESSEQVLADRIVFHSRERRGHKEFSIMAINGVRAETFGFSANDRISRFNRMMDSDRVLPTTLLHQSTTGGIGWPAFLSIVIAVVGIVIIGITLQCYKKKHGLSWNFCNKEDDKDSKEMDIVTI